MRLRKLEQPGALEILLFLKKNEGCMIREILEFIKDTGVGQYAFYTALKNLIEIGLVYDEISPGPPKRRRLFLTAEGKEIANLVEKIENVLHQVSHS